MSVLTNSRGALSLPLAMMLVASAAAGFGVLGLMRHWRQLTALQLRLDQCVGNAALDLKTSLQRIENENIEIRALRAAQAAADLVEAGGSLVPEIEALALAQDTEIAVWKGRRVLWLAKRGCDNQSDLPSPLPEMQWSTRLSDMDGPLPLTWSGDKRLVLQLDHSPRAASAVVQPKQGKGAAAIVEGAIGANQWKATWEIPREVPASLGARLVRTNFR